MTLGIGIMSFDRPDYLRGTLHGLMTNDLTDCDVWLFQDGATCHAMGTAMAEQDDLDACVTVFEECGFEHVVRHEHNIGIARGRLALFEQMNERYEAFIQIEDDVVMSRNCVSVMQHLLTQFEHAHDVGMVVSPIEIVEGREPNTIYNIGPMHLSCFATRREWFDPVLAHYREYCDVIGNRPYTPHEAYKAEIEALIGPERPCSSDSGLSWAGSTCCHWAWVMGEPRTRGIGVYGVHSRPETYERHRLGDVILRDYAGETDTPWSRNE